MTQTDKKPRRKTRQEEQRAIRTAVRLKLIGVDPKDIAEQLQVSDSTVNRYLNKGLKIDNGALKIFCEELVGELVKINEIKSQILFKLILSDKTPDSIKIKAIREHREDQKNQIDVLSRAGLLKLDPSKSELTIKSEATIEADVISKYLTDTFKSDHEQDKDEL